MIGNMTLALTSNMVTLMAPVAEMTNYVCIDSYLLNLFAFSVPYGHFCGLSNSEPAGDQLTEQ